MWRTRWVVGVLGVAACGGPAPVRPSDRAAYLRAVEAEPEAVLAQCLAIEHPQVRGECLTFAAAAAAEAGELEGALALCARADEGLWSDECHFAVADARGQVRGPAMRACNRAGGFARDCLAHVLKRDVAETGERVGQPGQELELRAEIDDMMQHYVADESRRAEAAHNLFVTLLARRQGERPFRAALCGVAPAEDCVASYALVLSAPSPWAKLPEACAGPRTAESLAARGVRPYDEGSAEVAARALDAACAEDALTGTQASGQERGEEAPLLPRGPYLKPPRPWRPPSVGQDDARPAGHQQPPPPQRAHR